MFLGKNVSKMIYLSKNMTNIRYYSNKNPFVKTWDVLSSEISQFFGNEKKHTIYPEHADVVIIGGGFIGSSVAYWLKTRAGEGLSVVVLEKDFTYQKAQNRLSFGTLSQHFSLPENIELAKHSVEFLRNIRENFSNNIDLQYYPTGYLSLASEKYVDKLEENMVALRESGVKIEQLLPDEIKKRFPWINTTDVKLGCMGMDGEGVFNSWEYLKSLVIKSKELGATYVNAEVTGFKMEVQRDVLMEGVSPGTFKRINKVMYTTADKQECEIKFAACVLAAGSESNDIAKLAEIGTGDGLLTIPLPIEKRQNKIFCVESESINTSFNTPVVMDSSGLWIRKNGLHNNMYCGNMPFLSEETNKLTNDEYLNNIIRPAFTNRVSSSLNTRFNYNFRVTEECDFNVFDGTGILGHHPYHNNLYIAAGFGNLGCVHSPGLGKAIAELIIDSGFMTIDLTRFGFDRLLTNQPLVECNVY